MGMMWLVLTQIESGCVPCSRVTQAWLVTTPKVLNFPWVSTYRSQVQLANPHPLSHQAPNCPGTSTNQCQFTSPPSPSLEILKVTSLSAWNSLSPPPPSSPCPSSIIKIRPLDVRLGSYINTHHFWKWCYYKASVKSSEGVCLVRQYSAYRLTKPDPEGIGNILLHIHCFLLGSWRISSLTYSLTVYYQLVTCVN